MGHIHLAIETTGGQGHCVCVCVCVHSTLSLSIHPLADAYTLLLRGQEDKVAGHRWAADPRVGNTCPFAGLLLTTPVLQAYQWTPLQKSTGAETLGVSRAFFMGISLLPPTQHVGFLDIPACCFSSLCRESSSCRQVSGSQWSHFA